MFRQVCYLSAARNAVSDADLVAMLDQSNRSNGPRQVTGLLAYGGGLFFQVIEGPRDCVEAVMARLRRDDRHYAIQTLRDIETTERDFAGWPMAFRALDPEAARMIALSVRGTSLPTASIVAALGDPSAAARLTRLPLAA